MKKYLALLWILLFLLTISTRLFSQEKLVFLYDNSGNCIEKYKTIVMKPAPVTRNVKNENPEENPEDAVETIETGLLNGHEIRIYPNPTQGNLKIVIQDIAEEKASLLLFEIGGKVLIHQNIEPDGVCFLNITQYKPGVYILRIIIDNEQTDWKIIKK